MGETSTVEALERIAATLSGGAVNTAQLVAREALPRARAEAEELERLRAKLDKWVKWSAANPPSSAEFEADR